MYIQFAAHIHHLLIDNEFILLDERDDKYYLLDEVSSAELLAGFDSNKINLSVSMFPSADILTMGIEKEEIKQVTMHRKGIGNHEWVNVAAYRLKEFSWMERVYAVFLVLSVKILLKTIGFSRVLGMLRRLALSDRAVGLAVIPSKLERLQRVAGAIYIVSYMLPCKIKCLESSIALYVFACVLKLKCKFRIGVQRYDFLAHAWIEFDGRVVADDPALSTVLPVILEI